MSERSRGDTNASVEPNMDVGSTALQTAYFSQSELEQKCQENAWLKHWGVEFREDPFMETDYKYSFTECSTIQELKTFILQGNWAIRCGFILENLVFINQVNGGDEWWTIKKFPDGELIAFESMSLRHIILNGNHDRSTFEQLIKRLLRATKEQCKTLEY